jgi:octaprenyl-diphosphate synthase
VSKIIQNQLKENSFSDIFKYLEVDLKKVDQIIIDNCQGDAQLISDIAKHIVLSGGKRVRPILTILSAKICGYNSQKNHHHELASAVELIHTATLLHDDVVDESMLRRGNKTANATWGNKASILVGDYLLSTAFQLMVRSGSLKVLDLLSFTSRIMSDGEVMQLMNSTCIDIQQEKYLQIISQKTAVLFSAATSVGAIIAGVDAKKEKDLYDFGNNLGIAFQIMEDVLDYSSSNEVFGKEVGDDFFEGKITLPVIITYEKASKEEKERIKEIFSDNLMSDEKNQDNLKEMMLLINKYQSIQASIDHSMSYHKKALNNLSQFDDSQEKQMLISILDYAVRRKK